MNDKIIRRLVALFAVIAAVLVVVAIVAVRNITRAVASSDWVNQTHAVILVLGELRAAFHSSDAALRTLAMTGNEQDEAAGRDALSNLEEHLEIAKALTRSDAGQAQQVGRLEALTLTRSKLTRDLLAARNAGQLETVRSLLAADTAAGVMAEVRRVTDKLEMEQMALLASRDTAAYLQAQTTRWTVWTGVALNFLLLGFTAWLVVDDIAARRRAAVIMQQANEQLETKVRERTAELTSANAALTAENLERRWGAQALKHQLRYNELIVNSISDPVFVLTKAQNVTRINSAVGQLTGWESTKVINRPLAEFVRLTEAPRHASPGGADPLAQALKGGRDLRDLAAVITDREKREYPVRFTFFPLRDSNKVVGGVVILRVETPAT